MNAAVMCARQYAARGLPLQEDLAAVEAELAGWYETMQRETKALKRIYKSQQAMEASISPAEAGPAGALVGAVPPKGCSGLARAEGLAGPAEDSPETGLGGCPGGSGQAGDPPVSRANPPQAAGPFVKKDGRAGGKADTIAARQHPQVTFRRSYIRLLLCPPVVSAAVV